MIIKKLTICNFRSYYGKKEFIFGDKLNLILGSNGDGKTTFFEALNWVLTPTEAARQNKEEEAKPDTLISAKLARELQDGEHKEVCVSIEITYDTEKFSKHKIIERGFTVTKNAGKVVPSNHYHDAFDCRGGEKGKKELMLRSVLESDAAFLRLLRNIIYLKEKISLTSSKIKILSRIFWTYMLMLKGLFRLSSLLTMQKLWQRKLWERAKQKRALRRRL